MQSPEEITVELMQQILREVEKDSTIIVLSSLLVEELNKDLHGGSCLSRVTVRYTKGGDQTQHTLPLIFKIIPNTACVMEAVKQSSMFPREIQMFNEVLPRISALLESAFPDRHAEFYARAYYTRKSPSYLIAIHDLATSGYEAAKRNQGLNLKQCHLAVRMIARFHAASVMVRKTDESLFSVFDEYAFQEDALNKPLMEIFSGFGGFVSHLVEKWPEFGPSWADRLRKCCETMGVNLRALWKRNDKAFNVLNHGDFGFHNMMFRHSKSGEVEAIMFVDFQCCSYNSPVLDLHQFLFSSTTDEVRANHTDSLLREYHDELTSTLELLGVPQEQSITLNQLLQDFESKMLYALFYSVSILPALSYDADSGITIEDLFTIGNDTYHKYESVLSDSYAKTLKRLLPIFSQKNLL